MCFSGTVVLANVQRLGLIFTVLKTNKRWKRKGEGHECFPIGCVVS